MKAKSNTQINRIPLFDAQGKKHETIELDKEIFNGKVNKALLYEVLRMYRANQRKGSASTKTRGEVRGGGKKPWRQKGTGRARFGSIRNPIWRGGGIAFGPHPRDFRYALPKYAKKMAFIASLNAKLKNGKLIAVEDVKISEPKTREVCNLFENLKIKDRALLLVTEIDRNLCLASRNIKNLMLRKVGDATALDVLSNNSVVMTKSAVGFLKTRAKK